MALEHALVALLDAAKRHGVGQDRLIIGIVGVHDEAKGTTPYVTHVGRTVTDGEIDKDASSMLSHVAKDLGREAGEQAQAAFDDERCPSCGGPRLVIRFRTDPPGSHRLPSRYECMDCNYKGPDR